MSLLRPVALTIFANDQDAYLDQLEAEQQAIDNALSPLDDKGIIKLHKENFTSSKRLVDLSIRYHGRIMLLHYAGHASGTQLALKGGGGHNKGLSQLLKRVPFVFLNGCASHGHVEALLENDVKAVIATSSAIGDTKSLEFSTTFYNMLAKGHTLGESFEKAKEGLELKYGNRSPKIGKGLKLKRKAADTFEWGIYTSSESIYNWKLPTQPRKSILEEVSAAHDVVQKPNRYLVKNVYKAIRVHSAAARRIREERKFTQPKPNFSEGAQVIGESFLTPISEEIRRLFTPKLARAFDIDRLEQLQVVYQRTIELVAFIMLSKLWNEASKADLTDEQHKRIQVFFELDEYTYQTFDYFEFTAFLNETIKGANIPHFVEEMEDLDFSASSKLSEIAAFFAEVKAELNEIKAHLVEDTCRQAEIKLSDFLKEFYFLVHYHMLVVKRIKILRLKNQAPKYLHDIIVLDNNKNNTQPDSTIIFDPYTDSDAVILFKDKANLGLNLAPFIIDQNALKQEDNSKIHYYSHMNLQGKYCYLSINDYSILEVKTDEDDEFDDEEDNPYKVVATQIKHAQKELLSSVATVVMADEEEDGFEDDDDDDWDDD